MARDATARQYDVDADAVRLNLAKGEILLSAELPFDRPESSLHSLCRLHS